MAVVREKPWTIDELARWLGYADVPRVIEIVRDQGVPYFWVGPKGKKFGDAGGHRYLRFVPSKVEAWAIAASVSNEAIGELIEPESAPLPSRPVAGGWKAAARPKLRGPRAGR